MKKIFILAIMAIMIIVLFAQEAPVRVKISRKTEDPSKLLIYYATTPDLQCHLVTKTNVLVGPNASTIPNSSVRVYKVTAINNAVLYLDKRWTYVFHGTSVGAEGFYSEIPLESLTNGPHDITWMAEVTYQKDGREITEEAYSLANWSQFAISKEIQNTRDPRKDHFEFFLDKTESRGNIVYPVTY